MKYDFFLTHGGMIDGVAIAAGGLIANIETPEGVDPIKAARAIASGMASGNKPAAAPAPAAQPQAPAVKLPAIERTKFPAP